MISWTVLGSGTHIASGRRGSPGHLAVVGETHLVVDCGAGTFHGLASAGSSPGRIAACAITHLHPDHVSDLVPLLFRIRNIVKETGEAKELHMIGPPGFSGFLSDLQLIHAPFLETSGLELKIHEGDRGRFDLPGIEIQFGPVAHGIDAIAFSVSDGAGSRIVYSGDTGRSADLIRLARGATLLVVEASYPNGESRPFHLTPAEAAEIAAEADVKGMVLVHLNPECDEVDPAGQCGDRFGGRIIVGEDALTLRCDGGELL